MKYIVENGSDCLYYDVRDEQGNCLPNKYKFIVDLLEGLLEHHGIEVEYDLGATTNKLITIQAQEYFELVKADFELDALYNAGVESWSGYGEALKDEECQELNNLSLDEFIEAYQLEIEE